MSTTTSCRRASTRLPASSGGGVANDATVTLCFGC
jgi:hypothetical protein